MDKPSEVFKITANKSFRKKLKNYVRISQTYAVFRENELSEYSVRKCEKMRIFGLKKKFRRDLPFSLETLLKIQNPR